MEIESSAGTTLMSPLSGRVPSRGRSRLGRPVRTTDMPREDIAVIAPSTTCAGA
jgi:hypothetical protein